MDFNKVEIWWKRALDVKYIYMTRWRQHQIKNISEHFSTKHLNFEGILVLCEEFAQNVNGNFGVFWHFLCKQTMKFIVWEIKGCLQLIASDSKSSLQDPILFLIESTTYKSKWYPCTIQNTFTSFLVFLCFYWQKILHGFLSGDVTVQRQ